jgi:hypothetical protein
VSEPVTVAVEYDAFISHASEDKDAFVRPLADFLKRLGLRVWYDEFTLDVGSSLSREIDKGLASSRFGIVVLSAAFLAKKWPEYELRGLVTREIDGHALILPVWHGIGKMEVAEYSPTLADKVALQTAHQSIPSIALRLLKVIDPPRHRDLSRWLLWQKTRSEATPELVALDSLKLGPIRHKALSPSLLVRAFLVNALLESAGLTSLESSIHNYQRDLYPHEEIERWEHLTAALVRAEADPRLSGASPKELLGDLLAISLRTPERSIESLDEGHGDRFEAVLEAYIGVVPDLEALLAPIEDLGAS